MKDDEVAGVKVGRPEVRPDKPSHVSGIHEGNERHRKQQGIEAVVDGHGLARATRSTGINADSHAPIDPRMPKITPA